ncbi:hypothetical protein F0A16_02705 [Salinicola corii]|uniref:Peptidase S74 domain-containing protein n=1 Tax=Salinicola corii TaxID=2606937 RepID=A0A640WJ85_9GAMM|nr:hypothetical protein [Salinicola corii]KAA0020716.1 hypothetical protein F0A16_02705 [Salinicola corii]
MTVSVESMHVFHQGDGAQQVFDFNFRAIDPSHIFVYILNEADGSYQQLTLNYDYSVTGTGTFSSGGEVILSSIVPTATQKVLITRILPLQQILDLRNQGSFFPENLEETYDRIVMMLQQLDWESGRSIKKDFWGLAWDALGLRIKNVGSPTSSTDAATKGYVDGVVDDIESSIGYIADLTRRAEKARDQAIMAAEASGDVKFFDTYADAAAATLEEGDVVEVFADENTNGMASRYVYESGVLVFKFHPGQGIVSTTDGQVTKSQSEWADDTVANSEFVQDYKVRRSRGALRWSDFAISSDPNVDQSQQLFEAIKALYDSDAQVLDLEGFPIGIANRVVCLAGENGFTNLPNVKRNQNNIICNFNIRWLGDDMPDQQMIEFGANYTEWPNAAFNHPIFFGGTIDSMGKQIGSILIYNFYNAIFRDIQFLNFCDQTSIYLRSVDNTGKWEGDNGATFHGCRWACLPSSAAYTGAPIVANCGDIVVEGGFSEWCGPHDYNYGSINIVNHHWSYGNNSTVNRFCAIFRDPRHITLVANDLDNAIFKFTNVGWMDNVVINDGSPNHIAKNTFKGVSIVSNKSGTNNLTPEGHGIVTMETDQSVTSIEGLNIVANSAEVLGHGGSAVPFLKLRTVGDGVFTNVRANYNQRSEYGVYCGDLTDTSVLPATSTFVTVAGDDNKLYYPSNNAPEGAAWSLHRGEEMVYKVNFDGTIQSPATHSSTTSNAANMFIGSSGNIQRTTSAMKYKVLDSYDVEDVANKWLQMDPFTYRDKNQYEEDPDSKLYLGMSADQAYELGLTCMVDDTSGEVENLFYERGVAINLYLIKKLFNEIEILKNS